MAERDLVYYLPMLAPENQIFLFFRCLDCKICNLLFDIFWFHSQSTHCRAAKSNELDSELWGTSETAEILEQK